MQKKLHALSSEKKNLTDKNTRLNATLNQIKSSKSYRFSLLLAAPVWKLRKLFGRLREKLSQTGRERNAVIYLLGTPAHGNLGDHMIAEAEIAFIQKYGRGRQIREFTLKQYNVQKQEICEMIRPEDILVFHGGGNIGNLWPGNELLRRDAFATWQKNRKIIMPQSICFTNDEEGELQWQETIKAYKDPNILLVCRDEASYAQANEKLSCRTLLTPDIVLSLGVRNSDAKPRPGHVLLILRHDKERLLTQEDTDYLFAVLQESGLADIEITDTVREAKSPETRKEALDEMFQKISESQLVVTDRMHGMIFSAISGVPCIAIAKTLYDKISGQYQWIQDLDYIECVKEIDEIPECIKRLRGRRGTYPAAKLQEKFRNLQKELR